MEAHEIAEKYRNTNPKTVELLEEVVKWCSDNADRLNLSDEDQKYLYTTATKYLMQIKIGRWNDDDAKVAINTFAKMSAAELDIDEDVAVKILSDEEYQAMGRNKNSKAVCIENTDDTYSLVYSPRVVEQLKSNNPDAFLDGLQAVFHEVVHAQQGSAIHRAEINGQTVEWSGNTYRSALETIVRQVNPDFYEDNYDSLFKENQAQFNGLRNALRYIKAFSPKLYELYDAKEMATRLQSYADRMYDNKEMKFGNVSAKRDALVDFICSKYISARPEIIDRFPVLQRAYNVDGSKKDIIQLIEDRQALMDNGQSNEKMDVLYETIANYRNYDNGELRAELDTLDEYVQATGTDDEFVFKLIEHRLGRMNLTEQGISQYMNAIRQEAAIARENLNSENLADTLGDGEQEIESRQEDSFRDEVGDENIPETESEKKEQEQVEAMWQNRFQSWDKEAAKLPDSAKRKDNAVKAMQSIERERKEQERDEQTEMNNQRQRGR